MKALDQSLDEKKVPLPKIDFTATCAQKTATDAIAGDHLNGIMKPPVFAEPNLPCYIK